MQEFALHEYVTAVLELQGGRDDNPRLWEDVAANPSLWGPNTVTPAELREVYLRVSGNPVSLLLMLFQCNNTVTLTPSVVVCMHQCIFLCQSHTNVMVALRMTSP